MTVGRTPSPRTEYRVVCGDGVAWDLIDFTLDECQQEVAVNGPLCGCGKDGHRVEQRTIYTTPWTTAPARTPSGDTP